jgi:hypothetical protein
VDLLLANLADGGIASCNYFLFTGSDDACWDPVLNARLGYEGFFVITHATEKGVVPLPELQPYYGVLLWPNFERSKHVRRELSRLRRRHFSSASSASSGGAAAGAAAGAEPQRRYKLVNGANPSRTWQLLDAYHVAKHGSNWLTKRYFDAMAAADADASVNFSMHSVELYEEGADVDSALPLAGEIGFSVGRVYTSLSGWTQVRSAENYGTAQLVLLGRWLQKRKYAFWSLGHCYCPAMQYKRELGQRIFPRQDFLELLRLHRGPTFLIPPPREEDKGGEDGAASSDGDGFRALRPGDMAGGIELLSPDGRGHEVPPLLPPPPEHPKG